MNPQNKKFDPTTRPAAVVGAGTLGMRIALMLASSGGEVRLCDAKPAQLDIAKRYVDSELPKLVKRPGAVAGRVVYAKTLEPAIADAWMVVEGVPEKLDLKKTIFGDLDLLAPKDAILASNSPSYPSSQIIDRVKNPSRVVNTHYYMPAGGDCRRGNVVWKDIGRGKSANEAALILRPRSLANLITNSGCLLVRAVGRGSESATLLRRRHSPGAQRTLGKRP